MCIELKVLMQNNNNEINKNESIFCYAFDACICKAYCRHFECRLKLVIFAELMK